MEKGLLHKQIRDFFVRNFDVRQEKEDELETIESIRKGIEFKGTNLWVLIFATFVASLGLNTNSTAVIIGAMLISPLMGDRKSTRLNSSHRHTSRMPSSA